MARASSQPGDLLEATSREIDDVQAQIDRLSDQAAAAAVDADTVREIGASHRKLHCKLLEEKQSELLEALLSRPDDETLMHALKSVTAELAAATPMQGLRAEMPCREGPSRRSGRDRADSDRLAYLALQAEREDLEEEHLDSAASPRELERASSATLRLSTPRAAEASAGLTEDEILRCAHAFSSGGRGIADARRHCGLQLSGAHETHGIPLHERLSLATDLLNVANFPPGSHLQQDAEWAGALLEGILPQTLDALALTREQREFFEPEQWSVEGVPREEDGSLRALLSTMHRLPCIWALLVVMTSAPPAPSASNARGYEGGGRLFYDARARTLLRGLAALYRVEWSKVLDMERMWLAQSVTTSSELESAGNVVEGAHNKPFNYKRAAKIGGATVIGGAGKFTAPCPSACPRTNQPDRLCSSTGAHWRHRRTGCRGGFRRCGICYRYWRRTHGDGISHSSLHHVWRSGRGPGRPLGGEAHRGYQGVQRFALPLVSS